MQLDKVWYATYCLQVRISKCVSEQFIVHTIQLCSYVEPVIPPAKIQTITCVKIFFSWQLSRRGTRLRLNQHGSGRSHEPIHVALCEPQEAEWDISLIQMVLR